MHFTNLSIMTEIAKYELLETCVPLDSMTPESWHLWCTHIASLLVSLHRPLSLVTLGANTNSLAYEIGIVAKEGKINSVEYALTYLEQPTLEQLIFIIEDDEFWLGHTLLTPKDLTENDILGLTILWNKELILAGIELFKMANDGTCFLWYNPLDSSLAMQRLTFLKEVF